MRAFFKAAALAAAVMLFAVPAFALDSSSALVSSAPAVAVVTTTPGGNDTTVITTPSGQPTTIQQGDTTVVVPYGNWLDQVLAAVQSSIGIIIAALVAWAFRKLPTTVVDVLRTLQAEQLLKRAADYGINATRGAVVGKDLELNVGNEAISKAVQYAIDNGPAWLVKWLGGREAIVDKMIARIPLATGVGSQDITAR